VLTKKQKAYLVLKRAIDIFGSLLGIILLSPLLLLCAFLTKVTSKGPIFFRQKRLGKNKAPFILFKFRSMRADAKQVAPSDISSAEQKSMETKWGSIMRKTSVDEIPQLFNILAGNMSFIGPRPSQDASVEGGLVQARDSFVPSPYLVKPGLSGLAQISMKRDHDVLQKAKFDSQYVQRLSFGLDLKLFVLSILVLFGFNRGR
jgi:lipopolysaccharide/colanic/teichoic acid biosynthesis glycosyltransferase